MTTYSEERRADRVTDAEQRRIDQAAAAERRAERERAADERAARLREQHRTEKARAKRERAEARTVRRAARGASLTAGNVYRKGTLVLVAASALGSLPAQVLHFVGISPMLLPLPLAIEGAAWVMAAGVAYADERGLPGWVRWFLRLLVVAAAGFAASINYAYGTHLSGLSASDAQAAGIGLAAVTLLGPLLFEIRQWVTNLSGQTGDADDKAGRVHDRKRRRQHRTVARLADRLVSAAPFGALSFEDAFAHAWEIETGTSTPGMSPKLHRRAARSLAALAEAQHPPQPNRFGRRFLRTPRPDRSVDTPTPSESADTSINRSTADLGKSTPLTLPVPVIIDMAKPAKPIVVRTAAAASPARDGSPAASRTLPDRLDRSAPPISCSKRPARRRRTGRIGS